MVYTQVACNAFSIYGKFKNLSDTYSPAGVKIQIKSKFKMCSFMFPLLLNTLKLNNLATKPRTQILTVFVTFELSMLRIHFTVQTYLYISEILLFCSVSIDI